MLRRPIAHRGLHNATANCMENTTSAFQAALDANFSIECDVQLTADGEAIVFHDETLPRLMNASGAVVARTTSELKALRFRKGGDTMQSLGELFALVGGRVPIIIEIKSLWNGDARLVSRVAELASSYHGPVAVMSFDPEVVAWLALHNPAITRGIVADRVIKGYHKPLAVSQRVALRSLSHLHKTKPHFISYDYSALPYAPVQQIRAQGFPVITWTVKSPEAAARALRYCDQITFEGYIPR